MPGIPLNQQLALFDFLLGEFGFRKFDDLRNRFRDMELDASVPGNSLFYQILVSFTRLLPSKLKQYDENIIAHLAIINTSRSQPIRLKYYQYFSLLFTEYYLDNYFADRGALLDKLNRHIEASAQAGVKDLEPYLEADLNKVAYWNATGSGKTFITHINILQLRHYAREYAASFRNLILLTPGEGLSKQHLEELTASSLTGNYYWEDKESRTVKVIDIHKIKEFASGEGVTTPLAEFDRNNAIFVDEGHKGDSKEDSQWRNVRATLSEQGFAFEYSATFGQIKDEGLQQEYAKCIIFDYSYGNFYRDGYGKDYWIHNLTDDKVIEGNREQRYLLQNLLLFLQQKLYYNANRVELEEYRIEDPLLIFVGTSVEPKAKGNQEEENRVVISDVKKVLDFFKNLFGKRQQFVKWIEDLRANKDSALFRQDYHSKLGYLFNHFPTSEAIYEACLKTLFHSGSPDGIELFTLRNAEGEIGVKIKNADHYFALIYIGDTSSFKTPLEKEYEFKKDVTSPSQFAALSDSRKTPVNILIGARKFIEGWNNYRVSSIGLINFGRSKGSQIIQLFGRGVRLWGKDSSLKRSADQPNSPASLEVVETLNIFGLRADYMRRFKEDLEREGIKAVTRTFTFPIKVREDLDQLKLYTLERDGSRASFQNTDVIRLRPEPTIKVRLDIAPKKFLAVAGADHVADDTQTVDVKLNSEHLDLLDWQDLYLKLISFKYDRKFTNLQISKNDLRSLIEGMDYRIISDAPISVSSLADVDRVQKLALEVLKRYSETFYRRNLQKYDGEQLKSVVLTKEDSNFKDVEWQLELLTTSPDGTEIRDIRAFLRQIETLATVTPEYPKKLKGDPILLNAWLDSHLYQPLMKGEANKESIQIHGLPLLENIRPPGLNLGEAAFVEHLKSFVVGQSDRFADYDFYLLRNMSRGAGFGFYFMAGGFYPDFMLWIKQETTGKQYLTFIDPHGLRNERNYWESDRIMLHKKIKDIETRLKNRNLVLNSFILQAPPGFRGAGVEQWHRDDDPLKKIGLVDYARGRNVFEIPIDGNMSGLNSYIDLMIRSILSSDSI